MKSESIAALPLRQTLNGVASSNHTRNASHHLPIGCRSPRKLDPDSNHTAGSSTSIAVNKYVLLPNKRTDQSFIKPETTRVQSIQKPTRCRTLGVGCIDTGDNAVP